MSLDLVKEIFSALPDCKEWHAHLLSFTHSRRNGTTYNCRRIELEPSERLSILIQDISSRYTDEGKNKLDNYVDVREYDGTCNTTTVYRIRENNPDIEIDLDALLHGIADSDMVDDEIAAAKEEDGPVGRVLELDVVDFHIMAFEEAEQLRRPPAAIGLQEVIVGGVLPVRVGSREPVFGGAVYQSAAEDGDVLLLDAEQQMLAVGVFGGAAPVLRADIDGVVVVEVRAGAEGRPMVDAEAAVAFQVEGSRQVGSRRKIDDAAVVNRLLDGGRVLGDAVADGTIVPDVPVIVHQCFLFTISLLPKWKK